LHFVIDATIFISYGQGDRQLADELMSATSAVVVARGMKLKIYRYIAVLALSIFSASPAKADISYNFEDGSTTGWSGVSGGSVSNGSDSGSLALKLTTSGTNQSALGTMPSLTLANIGDSISLSFSFRFDATPGDNAAGFRFALSNSRGTPSTADDNGYYISISTGAATKTHQIFRENGGTAPYLGGGDRTAIGATNSTASNITDTVQHTGMLVLTKSGASGTTISASIDGTSYFASVTDSSGLFTFDEIGISSANTSRNIWFDNVIVTSAAVPEPSSIFLVLAAGSGFLLRISRRKMRNCRDCLGA